MNETSENEISEVNLTQRDDDGCSRAWRPQGEISEVQQSQLFEKPAASASKEPPGRGAVVIGIS